MITTAFVRLGTKTYSYVMDDGSGDEKVKGTRKCVIKQGLKFEDHKNVCKIIKLY